MINPYFYISQVVTDPEGSVSERSGGDNTSTSEYVGASSPPPPPPSQSATNHTTSPTPANPHHPSTSSISTNKQGHGLPQSEKVQLKIYVLGFCGQFFEIPPYGFCSHLKNHQIFLKVLLQFMGVAFTFSFFGEIKS